MPKATGNPGSFFPSHGNTKHKKGIKMKTSTVLKKSLALLEGDGSRPRWTKGTLARNKYRHEIRVTNPNAVKFCAIGAVSHVLGINAAEERSPEFDEVVSYLRAEVPVDNYRPWNNWVDTFNDRDDTSFSDIRHLYKRAIKAAKGDGN